MGIKRIAGHSCLAVLLSIPGDANGECWRDHSTRTALAGSTYWAIVSEVSQGGLHALENVWSYCFQEERQSVPLAAT